jgi:hypothetical protein
LAQNLLSNLGDVAKRLVQFGINIAEHLHKLPTRWQTLLGIKIATTNLALNLQLAFDARKQAALAVWHQYC